MAEPCRCASAEEALAQGCRRAGTLMVGPLWELCSGNCPPERPCQPEIGDALRALWDSRPAPAADGLSGAERLRICVHRGRAVKGPDGKALEREY